MAKSTLKNAKMQKCKSANFLHKSFHFYLFSFKARFMNSFSEQVLIIKEHESSITTKTQIHRI